MRRITTTAIGLVFTAGLLSLGTSAGAARAAGPHAATAFPVSVTTSGGTAVIASRPNRILSLSASATQMLYDIGAGPQVVGVDKYSTWPANAPRTKFSGGETSAEGYLALRPDLVVLAYDTGHLVKQLRALHIPALVLGPAASVSAAEQQIAVLGRATGHDSGVSTEDSQLNRMLTAIVAPVGHKVAGRTFYLEFDPSYYSATSQTFAGSIFARLGMLDVADAAGKASDTYPQLSAEYLLKRNPNYVFLADALCCGQSPATFAKRSGMAALSAVHDGHVFALNDSDASEWGPHTMTVLLQAIVSDVDAANPASTA